MGFLEDVQLVAGELERHRGESISGAPPVVHQAPMAEVIETLGLKAHVEKGGISGEGFAEFRRRYLDLTVRLDHPGSLAHQVAVPHPAAALAMLVEGATIYEMGPAAVSIEAFLVDWLVAKVGWPAHAGGVFTHGDRWQT